LLEDPPAEETIRAATLSPAGLQAEGKPLPWEGLAALCAGAVSRPRGEPELILELAWLEPRRRLRVDAPRFDYSCLNARMGYGSAANLRRLAAELSRRAPRALLGQGLRAILDGAPGRERAYGSRAELERELRWLLTLRALERA
ncbi:MAG TPA: hypothetical protein VNI01_09360, partial [Elusimicrobiota bacterium]|nr:hypothetical protein [Elusimicrobiota bacterium]